MVAAFAGANPTAAVLKQAQQQTLSVLGINPSGLSDAALASAINVDTASATSLASAGMTSAVKAKVVAIFTSLDAIKTAGASASSITAALKAVVNLGSTSGASVQTATQMINKMADTIPTSEVNATVMTNVATSAQATETALALVALDSIEASADAAIKSASDLKSVINSATVITATQIDSNRTAASTAIQAALKAVYIDYTGTGTNRVDFNATGTAGYETNATISFDGNISTLPLLSFKLNDQNVSDMNYTATMSAVFQNAGNANYSYKVAFKNVVVDANSTGYIFSLGANSNVSYAGKSFTGVAATATTPTSGISTHTGKDTNLSLTGSIYNTTGRTDVNLSRIATWVHQMLDYNTSYGVANYGVNSNWSSTIILNLDDNASKAVTLYKKQADGKLSQASTKAVTVDALRNGAIIFDGNFTH
jgi:hypothetical protein